MAPGEWLVGLNGLVGNPAEKARQAAERLRALDGSGISMVRQLGEGRTTLIRAGDLGFDDISRILATIPGVDYVEPNFALSITDKFPTDPDFSDLYGLHNTGQTGGSPDADIDAPAAWDASTGDASLIVGVIDTGIDYTHQDLAANIWTNPGEVAGDGIDNDANGYVDDIHGWDWADNDADPMDDEGHGTHVSGTIGAVGNNGVGVAGVNWNVQLMALKFIGSGGYGSTAGAIEAIDYSTDMHKAGINVRLTNNSWGGSGNSRSLELAITENGNEGLLFVVAAGNSGDNIDTSPDYPPSFDLDNMISVAATNSHDQLAGFSNYGVNTVHLGAPGVGILSTTPQNNYGSSSGTSMASPHVAGAVALAWSTNPSASASAVKAALVDGVDPISALNGKTKSGGRLNVRGAIDRLNTDNTPPTTTGIANLTVDEDDPSSSIDLWRAFSDAENSDGELIYSVTQVEVPALFAAVQVNEGSPDQLLIDYAPDAFGTSIITVRATDLGGLFVETTFSVSILSVNDPPTMDPLANRAVNEDSGSTTLNLTGISSGASNESQTLSVTATSSDPSIVPHPTVNYVSANATGTLTISPVQNAFGTVTITVRIQDNGGTANGGDDTTELSFTLTVNSVNDAPTLNAISDPAAILEDAAEQSVSISGISAGPSNESQQVISVTASAIDPTLFSQITVSYTSPNATGTVRYTPAPNANGTTTIIVTVRDNGGTDRGGVDSTSQSFNVTITPVNDGPPTATSVTLNLNEDARSSVQLPGSVGVDLNEILTATVVTLPSRGKLYQTPDGLTLGDLFTSGNTPVTNGSRRVVFVPETDESNSPYTSFQFKVNDGTFDSAVATLTLNVISVNDPPTFSSIADPAPIDEDSPLQQLAILGISSGAPNETQTIQVSAVSNDPIGLPHPRVIYTSPNNTATLEYTPAANANGIFEITLTVRDNGGTSNGGSDTKFQTFQVVVRPVNDGAPIATPVDVTTDEDLAAVLVLQGTKGVDQNETLTAIVTSLPNRGVLYQTPDGVLRGEKILSPQTVVTNAEGKVIFVPGTEESGNPYASIEYRVNDGALDSNLATVQIIVRGINDPPTAGNDEYLLANGSGTVTSTLSLFTNDVDVERDTLRATITRQPAKGTVTILANGNFQFTPAPGFSGTDQFEYQVSDGNSTSNTATVKLISQDAILVQKLYQQVLGRAPENAGWQYWTSRITAGTASLGNVASGIFESPERLDPIINQMYRDYLVRGVDQAGLSYWRGIWQRDGGPENVIAGIVSSAEFFRSAGNSNVNWVAQVYVRLLRRPPDTLGLSYWASQLESNFQTRYQVVMGFLRNDEAYRLLVRDWFGQYFGRQPNAASLSTYVAMLQNGVSRRDVQIAMIDSDEYRNTPAAPAQGSAVRR